MFLSLTRVLRENIREGKLDYVHTSTVACLFNISTSLTGIHELPSMEYLMLCKALFHKYSKLLYKNTSEISTFADLTQLLIEILAKIMSAGLTNNIFLVQAVLHHSQLFSKLKHSELANSNITAICECIEACMKSIDTDNVQASILHASKLYSFPNATSEFLPCKEFVFNESPAKWEEFIVPYIWIEISNTIMSVPNIGRVVLFKHN